MTKNRTPTPVYLDPGRHPGLGVKGLKSIIAVDRITHKICIQLKRKKLTNAFMMIIN